MSCADDHAAAQHTHTDIEHDEHDGAAAATHAGHSYAVSADADSRYLVTARALLAAFMVAEVVVTESSKRRMPIRQLVAQRPGAGGPHHYPRPPDERASCVRRAARRQARA